MVASLQRIETLQGNYLTIKEYKLLTQVKFQFSLVKETI